MEPEKEPEAEKKPQEKEENKFLKMKKEARCEVLLPVEIYTLPIKKTH